MLYPMPFQFDRPTFVKVPFTACGRQWEKNAEFKWKEMSVDTQKAMTLYAIGYIHHNDELEVSAKVGDGLEALDTESLSSLVDEINKKVRLHSKNELEFNRRKCKKSKIADKQRGLIRSWRRGYGHLENL